MAGEQPMGTVRQRSPNQRGRDQLARVVVVGSFLTVFFLVGTLVALAKFDSGSAASGVAEKVFNAILPVLAGWVGTVLAFYFSSASQEHTSDLLEQAMDRTGRHSSDGTLVAEKMIPTSKILGLTDLATRDPNTINLSDLQAQFESKGGARNITRLMFVSGGAFKYLLHVGTLNAFLMKLGDKSGSLKLADLLKDPDVANEISKLVAFVSVATTLANAKAALDKVSGGQDIIVTATGNPTEPVLGWLTNVDLTKALTC